MSAAHINDLKSRVGDLEHKLSEARKALLDAQVAAAPVKIGDTVLYRGDEYRVTHIIPQWDGYWLHGNPKKKDGAWGISNRALYGDWKIPQQAAE